MRSLPGLGRVGPTALVIAIVLGSATPALADSWENIPTGSRTAAMGGAGIATGRDSAMPTLNPAGVALVPETTLSLSASLYHVSHVAIPNYYADDSSVEEVTYGHLDLSRQGLASTQFTSLPSSLALFLIPADSSLAFAFALSMPRDIQRRFVDHLEVNGDGLSDREKLVFNFDERQYQGSIAVAGKASETLRWGIAAVVGATLRSESSAQSGIFVAGNQGFGRADRNRALSGRSFDGTLVAGVQGGNSAEGFCYGLTLRAPSVHISGKLHYTNDQLAMGTFGDATSFLQTIDGDFRSGLPLRVGLGIAYASKDSWGLALDVTAYLPRTDELKFSGDQSQNAIGAAQVGVGTSVTSTLDQEIASQKGIDIALGFETKIGADRWLRAGLFSEATALATPDAGLEEPFAFPFGRFGASLGLGTLLGPVDTTFGIRAAVGRGSTGRFVPSQRLETPPVEATDASAYDVMTFLSAAIDSAAERAAAERLVGTPPPSGQVTGPGGQP